MDYKNLYNSFILYCKRYSVKERLFKRNPKDFRLLEDYIYIEKHHIIPKHDNGSDDINNYVILLPEEHLIAHKIRWKAYNQRGDMLAVRFCLNGLKGVKNYRIDEIKNNSRITKSIKQSFIWLKQNSYNFRKKHGWHSSEGLKNISNSRKNTVVVKNKKGDIFTVSCQDERYLRGELVHHSKGMITVRTKKDNKKVRITTNEYHKNKGLYNPPIISKGSKNNNFNHIFDKNKIMELFIINLNKITENNIYLSKNFLEILVKEINVSNVFKKDIKKTAIIKQRFGTPKNMIQEINALYNLSIIYNNKYVSKNTRNKLRLNNLKKVKNDKN